MAGKKYGLEDKYKMMYGGMTNPPVRASVGLFIRAGVAGAKKIAGALAKSKDIKVGSTLNKARDVSKYDTRTLTDKGAFVKRRKELGLGMKALPDTSSEFVKRSLQLRAGPLTADTLKKSNKKLSLLQKFKKSIKDARPDTNSEFVKRSLRLRAGSNSGKFSKTAKIGAIGGAGAVGYGTNEAIKDYSKLSQSEEFKKGREEGAKKSKELGEKIKNKTGKIVGYLIGKRMGGLQDEKLKPGAMYKANTGGITLKQVYALAKKNKVEDRVTQKDIDNAKIRLGYKDASPEIKADGAKYGKLIGNQRKLDINNDGKISKEDFKMLKSKKKK
jgi:hypothetical protein